MNKVAHYLQEHLDGEVTVAPDARRCFSTDASILQLVPEVVVYPRSESDIRKTARFSWQLAERGRIIPITSRGAGSDQSGAALGRGIILAFTAHMHRILEYDGKEGVVVVEPGANYGTIQQTLVTHGRFLPPYPASLRYSTIGGAVANNAAGEKSVKYGATSEYVRGLRVVLANGEVIETGPLNKRELNKKLGLTTFEGEIYRAVDALVEDHQDSIDKSILGLTKNAAGYNLIDVKQDGVFDLTPLFVGSQGTLGIITEVILDSEPHNTTTTLYRVQLDSIKEATAVIGELRKLSGMPSAIEMIDANLLNIVDEINPNQLGDLLKRPFAQTLLLVEFDDLSERSQKSLGKKAEKIFNKHKADYVVTTDRKEQERWWKLRSISAVVAAHAADRSRALPIIEDGIVPVEKLDEFYTDLEALFKKQKLRFAAWGHAGDGNLHTLPFMDLAEVGDRQKVFRIMKEYYDLVLKYKGSTTAEQNDGRVRAPFVKDLYGEDIYDLFVKLKKIFDPYDILNPGVKIGVTLDDIKPMLRSSYSLSHLYNYMPHN